jgi:uridylate kinase
MSAMRERVVVSVGGSLIVPGEIDTRFLAEFRSVIRVEIAREYSFVIISGGGSTARKYQQATEKVRGDLPREDVDWIGIHSTRLNAQLLRNVFAEEAYPHIIKNPTADISADEPVLIAGGWKPGWSTDYCAVLMAKNLGATKLVNLSDIDYVYSADPKKDKSAKPIEKISWADFRALIPSEWDPGIHSPFDPVAAKEAEQLNLEVAIINGKHLDRLSAYLAGSPFIGTIIS